MSTAFHGLTLLVVEDEPLIALDIAQAFESAGAHITSTNTLRHALPLVEHDGLSGAILDHALGEEDSSLLCTRLTERGVPFLIYSGSAPIEGAGQKAPYLTKPASREQLVAAMEKVISEARARQELQPRRLLIVEDEALIRLDIETQLQTVGYEIVGSVSNADAALRVAAQERPDLVLMDVRLAGSPDGIEVAFELWQRFRIRSLFISGNLELATRARAAPAQPWGFLSKPFSPPDLLNAINRKR